MALNSTDNVRGFEPCVLFSIKLALQPPFLHHAVASVVLIGLSSYVQLVEALVNRYGPIKPQETGARPVNNCQLALLPKNNCCIRSLKLSPVYCLLIIPLLSGT